MFQCLCAHTGKGDRQRLGILVNAATIINVDYPNWITPPTNLSPSPSPPPVPHPPLPLPLPTPIPTVSDLMTFCWENDEVHLHGLLTTKILSTKSHRRSPQKTVANFKSVTIFYVDKKKYFARKSEYELVFIIIVERWTETAYLKSIS